MPPEDLPSDYFDYTAKTQIVVDPELRKFFLDTQEMRKTLVLQQQEVTKLEEEIGHRVVIEAKLAPNIELCYGCKGSGHIHSNPRPGTYGPTKPPCPCCRGSGFLKKPHQKEL